MLPTVALVGRPNTGKSTLFNRLCGKKTSITFDEAGTTRDRVFQLVDYTGVPVLLVDTGGLEDGKPGDDMEANVKKQTMLAIEEADVILFVIDCREEITSSDFHAAQILRESKKPVILVASKADSGKVEDNAYNLYEFGFGEPIRVSAIHNSGIDHLNLIIEKKLRAMKLLKRSKERLAQLEGKITLSFVGKPNVGKSSLVNALLGKEQVIVSNEPGTTRDSVSLFFEYEGQDFVLIDTAGIRRSGKLRKSWIEKFSVIRSLKSIEESDIGILVFDSTEGLSKQDMRVSEFILEAKKGLIVVLNKADLVKPEQKNRLLAILRNKMPYAHFAPVVFTSALSGRNILEILSQASEIKEERFKKVKTRELNYFLERIVAKHPPAAGIKFKFIEQVDVNPPTFIIFVNKPEEVHFSYKRYLENEIRTEFGFVGTALDIKFKSKNRTKEE